MVDSYLFGGAQSIALVALEVIFWTYTDLYLEKFRVQLSGGAADWGFTTNCEKRIHFHPTNCEKLSKFFTIGWEHMLRFDHFQLEFEAHIWCVSSIHEYYLLVDYEFVTPSATVWTRTQFFAWLMWFIKETLVEPILAIVTFRLRVSHSQNPKLQPNGFLCSSCRINSVFQFCPPQSM